VIDISSPSDPLPLTTVKEIKHQVENGDTGTTFLLGSDGLTVVRRLSVENDYKVHLMQLSNNLNMGESGYSPSLSNRHRGHVTEALTSMVGREALPA
jgi:hypothetical protein